MKTVITGREFEVKQTGQKFFYWSTRAVRWLPVKRCNVLFTANDMRRLHASDHAAALAQARVMRNNADAHAWLMQKARFSRLYFKNARVVTE